MLAGSKTVTDLDQLISKLNKLRDKYGNIPVKRLFEDDEDYKASLYFQDKILEKHKECPLMIFHADVYYKNI